VPQVEVTFDIDANGILNVSARDKATGKQQSIVIKASSGLSDEEIQRMVRDAEAHAEEDKRFHELVNARNQADSLAHATKKSLDELGDKVEAQERQEIEAALEELKTALAGDDKAAIEAKAQKVAELSGKVAQRAYQGEGEAAGAAGAAGEERHAAPGDDNVVDADFEEVKDKK
jgi:molecular chaperone DnaK